ncbi:hypothetical protein [Streptomyces canus]|uniref:hypothetical protein n=1 Tax=Streptomyces canus TaxID=58343 RepID=UPI000749B0FD|nr:hypothetical protein [Streptomyces canus]KUN05690.1 hypothetical protein AQI96_34100 [Streptomyces canus]
MTEEELRAVEQRLRQIAEEAGLGWVIEQAYEQIVEGITKDDESPSRRSYNSWNYRAGLGGIGYQFEAVAGWSAPRRTVGLADRPVGERVLILIDAVYRVLTELPAVEREMLKNFSPSTALRVTPAASVSFAPDEDRPGYEIRTLAVDSEPGGDAVDGDERPQARAATVLSQLRALVVQS